jgi:hypothetical protein
MEAITKAKQLGGSICAIIPRQLVDDERIHVDDTLRIKVEKVDNLNFLWGKFKDIKKPTDQLMKEIDEGEDG